jgi:2,5-diketo-D-gluconate reductase B
MTNDMNQSSSPSYRGPIPQMGLGTYGRTGDDGLKAIRAGLEIGYRHIDTAQSYDTEGVIGQALSQSGIARDDVFITTKVAMGNLSRERFLPSLRESLDRLRTDRVDLTLIHWPSAGDAVPFAEYMTSLAAAQEQGMTRLIGVSNFTIAHLEQARSLLGAGMIVNNQVEVHPFLQNRKLCEYCARNGIAVTAYVPLAKGRVSEDPTLRRIAERHGVLASQVALAWLMSRGLVVIPASAKREHMQSNFEASLMRLSDDDIDAIDGLDRGERIIAPSNGPAWD